MPSPHTDRRTFLKATMAALAATKCDALRSCRDPGNVGERSEPSDELSALAGARAWINTPALTAEGLKGKVVLAQFWTFTCINWLRTAAYTRAWARAYGSSGLVVIGVHTPEFGFEHILDSVRRETVRLKVDYPVAVDSDYAIWRAFDNQYWPALYLLDATGRARYHHFGEGAYDKSEQMIRKLLMDAGAHPPVELGASARGTGIEAEADWSDLRSNENYVGYERTQNFASPGGAVRGDRHSYTSPRDLDLNHWALVGDWTLSPQSIALEKPNGRIAYRFHSRDLHLVMGPPAGARAVRFRVLLDGQPPNASHGLDVDANGTGVATEQRLYQLIRQPKPIVDRLFEIEFLDPGVEAYSFTFG
jgi:thiol-disulfide isomerase/thioredoxin